MTPDAPLSDEQIDKYEAAILNGQLMHGAPQIVYDLVQSHRALASERDELKYKMQVMADMVGEENWSLRNQLADAQARVKALEGLMHRATVNNVTAERVAEIRHVLGTCSLEADATPTLADEMDAYARQLEQQHAALTARCEWAMGQLLYYLPKQLDTEASKTYDTARNWLDEHRQALATGEGKGETK